MREFPLRCALKHVVLAGLGDFSSVIRGVISKWHLMSWTASTWNQCVSVCKGVNAASIWDRGGLWDEGFRTWSPCYPHSSLPYSSTHPFSTTRAYFSPPLGVSSPPELPSNIAAEMWKRGRLHGTRVGGEEEVWPTGRGGEEFNFTLKHYSLRLMWKRPFFFFFPNTLCSCRVILWHS